MLVHWLVIEDAKKKGKLNDLVYFRVEKVKYASKGGREKGIGVRLHR